MQVIMNCNTDETVEEMASWAEETLAKEQSVDPSVTISITISIPFTYAYNIVGCQVQLQSMNSDLLWPL